MGVINADLARRLRAAVGFCNIAVRNYQAVDWGIVLAISHQRLGDFRDFARALSALASAWPQKNGRTSRRGRSWSPCS